MNNEPVAWMTAKGIQDVCTVNEKEEMGNDFDDYIIPLYTHPAKTLTVQEIMQQTHRNISEAHWKTKTLTDEEIKQIFGNETGFDMDSGCFRGVALIDFARAILRKTQEK